MMLEITIAMAVIGFVAVGIGWVFGQTLPLPWSVVVAGLVGGTFGYAVMWWVVR